jgi:nucleoside-diphosphate kinase
MPISQLEVVNWFICLLVYWFIGLGSLDLISNFELQTSNLIHHISYIIYQTSNSLSLRPKYKKMTNRTFTMIKPDATEKGYTGGILEMINKAGFRIVAMKMTHLSTAKAGEFYAVHKERPFYGELVEFMSRGPITAAILEKENAVEDFRTLIGATNPANAAEGTIRKKYAASIGENAVHGSDSDENAAIEGDFFFSKLEQF